MSEEKKFSVSESTPDAEYALKDKIIKWTFHSNVTINLYKTPTNIIEKVIKLPDYSGKWIVQVFATIQHVNSNFFIKIDDSIESQKWGNGTQNSWNVVTFVENFELKAEKYLFSLRGCGDAANNQVVKAQLSIIAFKK